MDPRQENGTDPEMQLTDSETQGVCPGKDLDEESLKGKGEA